jgi:predicted acylesterase/phospholipase RssA
VTGVAWELGVLRGLEAGGVPVAEVDLVAGTSAGAIVGAARAGLAQGGRAAGQVMALWTAPAPPTAG